MTLLNFAAQFASRYGFDPAVIRQELDEANLHNAYEMNRKLREQIPFRTRDLKPRDAKGLRVSLPAIEFCLSEPPVYFIVWVYTSTRKPGPPIRKLMINRITPPP